MVDNKVVGALLDDRYASHWTEAVKKCLREEGVEHIMVFGTKIGQPNDFTINHLIEQDIRKQLYAWCALRRRIVHEGGTVPRITRQLLMSKHLVSEFRLCVLTWLMCVASGSHITRIYG